MVSRNCRHLILHLRFELHKQKNLKNRKTKKIRKQENPYKNIKLEKDKKNHKTRSGELFVCIKLNIGRFLNFDV